MGASDEEERVVTDPMAGSDALDHYQLCTAEVWGGVCGKRTRTAVIGEPRCAEHRVIPPDRDES